MTDDDYRALADFIELDYEAWEIQNHPERYCSFVYRDDIQETEEEIE